MKFFERRSLDWILLYFHLRPLFSQVGVEWSRTVQGGVGRQEKRNLFGSWNKNSWSLILSIGILTKRRNFPLSWWSVRGSCAHPLWRGGSGPAPGMSLPTGRAPRPCCPQSLSLGAPWCSGLAWSTCYCTATLTHPDKLFVQKTAASLTKNKNTLLRNAIKDIALKKNRCSTPITNYNLLALKNQCRNWS